MAHLRLIDHYIPGTAGGCCHFCRTSQRSVDGVPEAVVATSVELSEGGEIALCEACVREAAHLVGMVDGAAVTAAVSAADEARLARAAAEAERDEAVAIAQALRRWDDRTPANGDGAEEQAASPPAATPRKRGPRA